MRSDNIKFRDITWNTLGTITYAAVSLLLSLVVIRICGDIEGGIFSFGFSTLAHLVFIVSFFGIRPIHIVDIKYKYSFSDYVSFGLKSMLLALSFGIIYILYRFLTGTYSSLKTILLLILVLHGAIDGFADFYESEYQRVNKLYMGGQSQFFRIAFFAVSLVITLIFTNSLLLAEITAITIEIIFFYFLNIHRSKKVYKCAKLDDKSFKKNILFMDALPLFLITFLDFYIFASAKISIDANLVTESNLLMTSDKYNGFFGLAFMPTNIIYLAMTLLMKPMLTPLSNAYYSDKNKYNRLLLVMLIFALIISVIALVFALFFGKVYFDIVNIILGGKYEWARNITIYRGFSLDYIVLIIVVFGGIFYTVCTPIYYAIIIENKQKYLLISYIIVALVSLFMSKYCVKNEGIIGAAISFVISMFLTFLGIIIIKVLTKK